MKKAITLLTLAAALAITPIHASMQGAEIESHSYTYESDSVRVTMQLDLSQLDIRSTESVVFTPTITTNDRADALPTIVVRGRSGAKSYKRATTLGSQREAEMYGKLYQTPYTVVDYYGKKRGNNLVDYSYTLPYEQWMAHSEVEVNTARYSCCCSDEGENYPLSPLELDIPSVDRYDFIPRIGLIKPEKVAVKRSYVNHSAHIIFRVNSSYIDPNLANNRQELADIDKMMQSIVSDKDYTVTAINIVGYASPEGRYDINQRLAKDRATSLQRRLINTYDIDSKLYDVEFGGENWADLVPMVAQSDIVGKEKIIAVAEETSLGEKRKELIKSANGWSSYKFILDNYYPTLRKANITVDYNIDAYDLDRIKELIDTKPQNLSLEEMYRLSETYAMESDEFLDIFLKAVEQYPNDVVALHNAMVSAMKSGNMDAAAPFAERLKPLETSAETTNAVGAYYAQIGDYEAATPLLERAVELGSEEAQYNLDQMKIKQDTDLQIEEYQALRRKIYGDQAED